MAYTVYILKCNDNSLYVGSTNNLEKRIQQHNELKSGAHYTKIRRPVMLMYSESYSTLKEARAREAELKGWGREKKIELIKKKITEQLWQGGTEVARPNVPNSRGGEGRKSSP